MFALIEFLEHWSTVLAAVGVLCVGAGLGRIFWPAKRTGKQLPLSDDLLDVAYEVGVAKAGEPR